MLPDISVIVTCYNYGKYLERCLRSLFNQLYTDNFLYEVILVDDCSTDNTANICGKFSAKFNNLIYLHNAKNVGLQISSNIGIGASSGRYIVRVDADDYVARHFLFLLKLALDKNRKYQAFASDYCEVDIFENILRQASFQEEQMACAVMYRREFLFDVGLYDHSFEYREGHELNQRFSAKYKIGYLPIPLYFARKHDANRSNNAEMVSEFDNKLGQNG